MISAVVLAAGRSSRMGRPKLALRLGGIPVLEKVLVALRAAKVDEVLVVLGADAGLIRRRVRFRGERVVFNETHAHGMSSSLRAGLGKVGPDSEAAMIVLGDQPFLLSSTVDKIVDGFRETRSRIVVPVFQGRRGNPVLFARILFPEIMRVVGDVGARSVVRAHSDEVLEVPVDDPGVVTDLDVPSDYDRATSTPSRVRKRRSLASA